MTSRAARPRRCSACAACEFVSFSLASEDCSWYASCDLGELQPPVAVALGVGSTSELAATYVAVVNGPEGAYVTATLPPYPWAASFSRADVSITDGLGRSAVLFAAFEYSPGWRPYAATAVALLAFVVLATRTLPAFIRAGCEAPKEVSDDPKALV